MRPTSTLGMNRSLCSRRSVLLAPSHATIRIRARQVVRAGDLAAGFDVYAQLRRALGEHLEQLRPADAVAEPVGFGTGPAELERLSVPLVGVLPYAARGFRISRAELNEQVAPKHHAPPGRCLDGAAVDDGDLVLGAHPLHQDCEVQAGRSAADANDSQLVAP